MLPMECSPAQTSLFKTRAVASTSLKLLVLHVSRLRDIYSCTFLKWKNVCSVYICSLSLSCPMGNESIKLQWFSSNKNVCTIFLFKTLFISRDKIGSRYPFDRKCFLKLTHDTAWQSQKRVNKLPRQYLLCPLDFYALLVSKVTGKKKWNTRVATETPKPCQHLSSNSDKWYLLNQD